jgi:hypothetical protein
MNMITEGLLESKSPRWKSEATSIMVNQAAADGRKYLYAIYRRSKRAQSEPAPRKISQPPITRDIKGVNCHGQNPPA